MIMEPAPSFGSGIEQFYFYLLRCSLICNNFILISFFPFHNLRRFVTMKTKKKKISSSFLDNQHLASNKSGQKSRWSLFLFYVPIFRNYVRSKKFLFEKGQDLTLLLFDPLTLFLKLILLLNRVPFIRFLSTSFAYFFFQVRILHSSVILEKLKKN